MDQLLRLKESIFGYLSPAKRRRTALPATPDDKLHSMQRPVKPMTEPKDSRHKAVISGRVSKKYLSPSDAKLSRARKSQRASTAYDDKNEEVSGNMDDEMQDVETVNSDIDLEASSLQLMRQELEADDLNYEKDNFALDEDNPGIRESKDNYTPGEDSRDSIDSKERFKEESELDVETKVHRFLDEQAELTRIRASVEDIKGKGWHKDEVALFRKLSMRGLEPLLPANWAHEFPTFPSELFSRKFEETFVNARSGEEFRGSAALASLVTLGGRVRDLILQGKPQERLIEKEINNYIRWSKRDGGYAKKLFIPRLCVVAGLPGQELSLVSKAIKHRMYSLAGQHHQALVLPEPVIDSEGVKKRYSQRLPLLYGIIVAHCVIVMVALDPSEQVPKVKTIAHFDLSDGEMDVWNGLAIAILVCTVRNKLMEHLKTTENTLNESSDPDL